MATANGPSSYSERLEAPAIENVRDLVEAALDNNDMGPLVHTLTTSRHVACKGPWHHASPVLQKHVRAACRSTTCLQSDWEVNQ